MSILNFLFGRKVGSASIAKDRLQIIIAQERVLSQAPDYLPMLQKELMEVLAKYVHISTDDIKINHETKNGIDVLELNITLPENKLNKESSPN